jgi:hypothetical protein
LSVSYGICGGQKALCDPIGAREPRLAMHQAS